MSAFDDLTLGDVEEITNVALGGKSIDAADPLMLAGGVMWITQRKLDESLTWEHFKATTKMADIKSFSLDMEASELNPTNVPNGQTI